MADGDTLFIYPEIKVRRDPDADGIRIRSGVINFDDKTREPDFCSYSDGALVGGAQGGRRQRQARRRREGDNDNAAGSCEASGKLPSLP